jgi:hypothetical protein
MDYKDALYILEIDFNKVEYNSLTLKYLNKQYKKMALKHHPDKNGNTIESNEKFKKINEAYTYLKDELKYMKPEDFCETEENIFNDDQFVYLNVLKNFIKSVFESKYIDVVAKIISDILNTGKKISIKIFEELDKDTTLNIYHFLSKYKKILHLSDDIIDEVRSIVLHKYDNVQIYKLNPSINDLINANFYKLYVEKQLFLVPLWYNESYFDNSGCEIIAICDPVLPNNMHIDDDNNLMVEINLSICETIYEMIKNNEELLIFNIGDKKFTVPLSKLRLIKEQYYFLKGMGLVNVKQDIYDMTNKSDIIVKIILN